MANEHEHPAQPEESEHGFEEGFDRKPDDSHEDDVGRFSTGGEQTPEHAAEKEHHGRFSEGAEQTPETEEKTAEGDFATGSEQIPEP